MERKTVKLQGFDVDTFTFEDAVKYIKANSGNVVTINPEMIQYAKKNADFKTLVKSADLVIPDGIGVEIGLKILGHNVRRIAGIEFAQKLIEEYSKDSLPIALVGAKPEITEKAVENLKKTYPSINICYSHDGYFKEDAPVIYQKLGLEWLYRTLKEPQRFKRIFPTLPLFVINVLFEKMFGDKSC